MKRKIAIGIVCMAGGIFLSVNAFGQVSVPVPEGASTAFFDPKFFVAIVAGVLIALGFQMVLTNLSVAAGITAVGDIHKKAHDTTPEKPEKENKKKNKGKSTSIGVILSSAAGGWTLLTAAISLFFASLFAVKLSLVSDNGIGAALGLVIWAVFMMTMVYLESKAIGSLVNGLFSTAIGAVKAGFKGLSSVGSGVGSIFRKSESAKMKDVAENTVNRIKTEINEFAEASDLKNNLKALVDNLQVKSIDYNKLREEIATLINEISIEQKSGEHPGEKELFLKVAEKQPHISKHETSKLSHLFDVAKSAMKIAGVLGVTGGAAGVANNVYNKHKLGDIKVEVENKLLKLPYLRPDVVHAELEEIFNNETNTENLRKHEGSDLFDKEYVAAVVADQRNVPRGEALMTAYKVEEAINEILKKSRITEIAGSKVDHLKHKVMDSITAKKDEFILGIESRIEAFFKKINRPEFDYQVLKSEFEYVLHNPKMAPEVLKRKLKQMDRDSFIALISSNDKYSKQDVEGIFHKFEEAKMNVLRKIESAETGFNDRVLMAKDFALEQAENTRKSAAAASWWLFAALVISGAASVLGGMAAL